MQLVKYDAACHAIAEAKAVDEVKDWRDKASALQAYARQAKNKQLEVDAAEIRIRAERRLGKMLEQEGPQHGGDRKTESSSSAPTLNDMGISKDLSSRAQQIASIPDAEFEETLKEHREDQKAVTGRTMERLSKLGVHHSSASSEHYTPPEIINLCIRVMGHIDVDPCANPEKSVPAHAHYTEKENGLTRTWNGRVFMNPPYGEGIGKWALKFVESYLSGTMTEGIALVPARTDTKWWYLFRECAVCFIRGRLTFINNTAPAPFPSALVYLGDDPQYFIAEASEIGDVWSRVNE